MKLKPETIVEETQREAIVNRPHNLAGSVQRVYKDRFNISPESILFANTKIVPAMLKLFQEALDNPIDVAIKTQFKSANKIDIHVDAKSIKIKDNGYGISSSQDENGEYILYKAFCKYNTSSNYKDANEGQKGVNGIGIKLCTTLSKKLVVTSDDGIKKVKVTATDNNLNHEVSEYKSNNTGTEVEFWPDFNIFEIDVIDEEHINRMFEYTLIQALTYPDIDFRFNGKSVKYNSKKFLGLFELEFILHESENYFLAFLPNDTDEFRHITFINGLETSRGGSHINYVMTNITNSIREKLVKKFKSIKPADIKNKIQLVIVASNFKGLKWDGQTKESITNPEKDMKDYFEGLDFEVLSKKIMRNPAIIEPITEVYKIKEEFKLRQELKNAEKPEKKKPKDEKFLPPIGDWKRLYIAEGDSASAGLSKIIGRQGNGFFAMFGVPPNAYDMDMKDIVKSDKLKSLQNILGLKYSQNVQDSINFEEIIIATDADLPGFFIRGQLLGLFCRFGKNLFTENRIKILRTPVIVGYDSKENIKIWFYDAEELKEYEVKNPNSKLTFAWKKGLGSWDQSELEYVIEKEGLDVMLETMVMDDLAEESLDNWLNGKNADKRKEMLEGFEFSITNL